MFSRKGYQWCFVRYISMAVVITTRLKHLSVSPLYQHVPGIYQSKTTDVQQRPSVCCSDLAVSSICFILTDMLIFPTANIWQWPDIFKQHWHKQRRPSEDKHMSPVLNALLISYLYIKDGVIASIYPFNTIKNICHTSFSTTISLYARNHKSLLHDIVHTTFFLSVKVKRQFLVNVDPVRAW